MTNQKDTVEMPDEFFIDDEYCAWLSSSENFKTTKYIRADKHQSAKEPSSQHIHDAIKSAKAEIQYCHDELRGDKSLEVGWGGMTYGDLENLIAVAEKQPTCVTVDDLMHRFYDCSLHYIFLCLAMEHSHGLRIVGGIA